jgi:hypothetical protein
MSELADFLLFLLLSILNPSLQDDATHIQGGSFPLFKLSGNSPKDTSEMCFTNLSDSQSNKVDNPN